MQRSKLVKEIKAKKSMLCVGLDTTFEKLPKHLRKLDLKEAMLTFNKAIIESTSEYAVAYIINTAFYEQYGSLGWEIMEETLDYIPENIFTIADAKRGDIGNTSKMYAKTFFESMYFDAVTVAPYMGEDSIRPFLEFDNKWVICLGLTSNKGSSDLQKMDMLNGDKVYQHMMKKVASWGSPDNLMFVTGATHPAELKDIRMEFPNHFFLVPGVGAQGGSAADVCHAASHKTDGGLLINSSRAIIYSSSDDDYAEAAKIASKALVGDMHSSFA